MTLEEMINFYNDEDEAISLEDWIKENQDREFQISDFSDIIAHLLRGPAGRPGPTGPAGRAGKTPVKGKDYWTEEDKEEIVAEVLKRLTTTDVKSFKEASPKEKKFEFEVLKSNRKEEKEPKKPFDLEDIKDRETAAIYRSVGRYKEKGLDKDSVVPWEEEERQPIEKGPATFKNGEEYYYLTSGGEWCKNRWGYIKSLNEKNYEMGNAFKTREEADLVAQRLKLRRKMKEYGAREAMDWDNLWGEAYTFTYNPYTHDVEISYVTKPEFGVFYFPRFIDAVAAEEAIGKDTIKKYFFRKPLDK